MNYIKKLQRENKILRSTIEDSVKMIESFQSYYLGDKFQGKEKDYAHVSTDVLVRLSELKFFINSNSDL